MVVTERQFLNLEKLVTRLHIPGKLTYDTNEIEIHVDEIGLLGDSVQSFLSVTYNYEEPDDSSLDISVLNIHLTPVGEQVVLDEELYYEVIHKPNIVIGSMEYQVDIVTQHSTLIPNSEDYFDDDDEEDERSEVWLAIKIELDTVTGITIPGALKGGLDEVLTELDEWKDGSVIQASYTYLLPDDGDPEVTTLLNVHCYKSSYGYIPPEAEYSKRIRRPDVILNGVSYDIWLVTAEFTED